jgi:hypothetical protein
VNTPVRWLEAGGNAPNGAADLLSAAAPPPAFSDAVRYRLAVGVAKTAALPVTSVWTSLLVKGAFVASIGGASGFVVHAISSKHDAPASLPAPAPAAPRAVLMHENQPPPVAVDALPALQLPTAAPDRAPKLQLDPRLEEAELLEKARSLVGSNPAAALRLTAEHSRDFPRGRLGAEADLIAAQSLLGMGKVAAAKQRAQASLARYPRGLYARQLREIVEQ